MRRMGRQQLAMKPQAFRAQLSDTILLISKDDLLRARQKEVSALRKDFLSSIDRYNVLVDGAL